jgi:quinol monooxygenase YgiN
MIRARVDLDQRRELMQMCQSWLVADQLPTACLERRVYEDAAAPTNLMLVEEWLDTSAMNAYVSSERFRALIGAMKVLGELVDVRVSETKVVEEG